MAQQKKARAEATEAEVKTLEAVDEQTRNKIKPGMTIRVHQILVEKNAKGEDKKRVQVFEGIVLARKHGSEAGSSITVRKIASGVGVEKIFPLHSPWISKIELVKQAAVRRAKLSYLRSYGKRLKEKSLS